MIGYLGQVIPFAGLTAPSGWHFCDGTLFNSSANSSLFSLIGFKYGGDGRSEFALPDLRGRIPIGTGSSSVGTETYGGAEKTALSQDNLPENLGVMVSSNDASENVPIDGMAMAAQGVSEGRTFDGTLSYAQAEPDMPILAGGGDSTPYNNVMPFQVVNYIICIVGVYPSKA
ncbi:MAG: tail fiber protein [Gilvibacter sp.]